MRMHRRARFSAFLAVAILATGCKTEEPSAGALGETCDPSDGEACEAGLACAELVDSSHACEPKLIVRGMVSDAETTSIVAGAHLLALDETSVAISDVATSAADGTYELEIPVRREIDGTPVADRTLMLRANAADYQSFPGGIRQSLPISTSTVAFDDDAGAYVLESALTDVTLIPLPDDGTPRVSISGTVVADAPAGVLVVAHGDLMPAPSAITDLQGRYTLFNVTAGDREVRGYKVGIQLEPNPVVVADAALTGIDLSTSDVPTSQVSGEVEIVDSMLATPTSVVLAVSDTFADSLARGEVPAGIRTPLDVTTSFAIEGVPAGDYVVLAAFENEGLVRDPDTSIAGTELVMITVSAGEDVAIAEHFKVTQALAVTSPGETTPTEVTGAPTLIWATDASANYYTVEVYDALGELVWDPPNIVPPMGASTVSIEYGGPLDPGMYYQFRAVSWREATMALEAAPISMTEDLRGVFYVE